MTDPTPEAYWLAQSTFAAAMAANARAANENRQPGEWMTLNLDPIIDQVTAVVWPLAQQVKAAEILGVVRDQLDQPVDTRESILAWLETQVRAKVAAEIRAEADKIAVRAEVAARVKAGTADEHPLLVGVEFAARIAEGNGDQPGMPDAPVGSGG